MTQNNTPTTAFNLLLHYAFRSRACASSLPETSPQEQSWTGIGFSLGEQSFLVPMSDITEILNLPHCTRIPRTKSFVRGAANIRGSVVPVIDLMAFFQKPSTRVARLRRVLVVDYRESSTGLIVDDILGMQHFSAMNYEASISSELEPCFHGYLSGTYFRYSKTNHRENCSPSNPLQHRHSGHQISSMPIKSDQSVPEQC